MVTACSNVATRLSVMPKISKKSIQNGLARDEKCAAIAAESRPAASPPSPPYRPEPGDQPSLSVRRKATTSSISLGVSAGASPGRRS